MEAPPKYPVYTSGKFWGGTVMPFWVLMLFTAFPLTGFFGIDHLLFRSPSTAFQKAFTNIFTLGLWYFYDMVQVFGDKQFVKEYGLSKPVSGPAGLGLDYFRGILGRDTLAASKSSVLSIVFFLMYIFLVLSPFGISNFVAGDVEGGIGKFLLSFGPWGLFWIPFLFVAGFFEIFRNITETEKIFTEGAIRPTPLSFILEPTGYSPNIMNPETIAKIVAEREKEANKPWFSFYDTLVKPVLSFFGIVDPKEILDTAKCTVVPPVAQTVTAATTAAQGVAKVAGTVPAIATEATAKLSAFTDPAKLKEAALAAGKVQTGGGTGNDMMDYLFVGGLGFLIVGGLFAAFLRKAIRRQDGEGDSRDDRPSEPRLL